MSPTTIAYGYLGLAIICEVLGTTFMAKSAEFTRLAPTTVMAILYGISLFFLAKSLRVILLGVAYAIWGGLGIVLTSVVGLFVFKQSLGLPAILGIALIVSGVVILNVFSNTVPH
ncbi:DMT family transporter [Psychrobacter pygoscelis]|uniref:DMT family transporter n=1 Tax=Psychrobacter pygoscelis TaxID=2488563 RepID=UPI001039ABD2|nr:multidrug efflux SMR transporter [Psychrobacter pygoscelis]